MMLIETVSHVVDPSNHTELIILLQSISGTLARCNNNPVAECSVLDSHKLPQNSIIADTDKLYYTTPQLATYPSNLQ